MGFISTYIVKPFYNLGCYGVTLACYFFGSSVKQEEVSNLLSNVETLPETEHIDSVVDLGNFHEKMGSVKGTMQWRSQKWQEQNPGRSLPFEQRYRLAFLNKLLQEEEQKLQQIIEPLLQAKEEAIKISIKCFVPIDHLTDYLTKDIMSFAYVSQDECIYYFLMRHYPKRAKMVATSYDYTPCYYLLLYMLVGSEWYFLIKCFLGERCVIQFYKRPLKLYGDYKISFHHAYLKTIHHIEGQVKHGLSLCGDRLTNESMTMMVSTPLADALMLQNTTAIKEAIADRQFHGITHNATSDYLLIPFINVFGVNEKEVAPLTADRFCEYAYFAPHLLPNLIYDSIKIEVKNNVGNIENDAYRLMQRDKAYYHLFTIPIFILLAYNHLREEQTSGDYPIYWPIEMTQVCMILLLMLSPLLNICYPPF